MIASKIFASLDANDEASFGNFPPSVYYLAGIVQGEHCSVMTVGLTIPIKINTSHKALEISHEIPSIFKSPSSKINIYLFLMKINI